MPYSRTQARKATVLLCWLWLAAVAAAADPKPIAFQPEGHLELGLLQITISSVSAREDFVAATSALSDVVSWEIRLKGHPVPIERILLAVRERTVTLVFPGGSLGTTDPSEIPDGDLAVMYRPVPSSVKIPTGPKKLSPTRGWLDGCLAFGLTEDKKKADIDITGGVQAGYNAKPQYFWSVKAKCAMLGSVYRLGEVGPSFTGEASQQRNADPDALKAAITYRKLKPSQNTPTGWEFVADGLSYEFERSLKKEAVLDEGKPAQQQFIEKNSNVMWGGIVRYVYGYPSLNWTVGLAGFEAGRTVTRTVKKDSNSTEQQRVTRLLFDFDMYKGCFRKGGKRAVTFHANHTLRLPFVQEPYLRETENSGKMYLTNKPRHWTLVELVVHLADGAGINLQYKRGSLPPSFEFVNHQLTIGFNLMLRRS